MTARVFIIANDAVRQRVSDYALHDAPAGWEVLFRPEPMPENKKKRFHAVCGELAKSGVAWAGRRRTLPEWKTLLISGHAVATGQQVEVVQGLEGELIDIRESTSSMDRRRGNSLVQYAEAFAINNGVRLKALVSEEA